MDRDWVWALIGVGAALWAIGGSGPKWARRYLWPSVVAAAAVSVHLPVISIVVGWVGMVFAHSLGYGDKKMDIERISAFFALGACLFPFQVSVWGVTAVFMTAILCWELTNRIHHFQHKYFELAIGASQGAVIAWSFLTR